MTIELEPIELKLSELQEDQKRSESERLKVQKKAQFGTILATVGVTVAVLALGLAFVKKGNQGDAGLACWDANSNGKCEHHSEDINKDQVCDTLDCRGSVGPPSNVPVGTILAWHKNPAATPDGMNPGPSLELNQPGSLVLWIECNGPGTTDDPSTPFDEMLIPDLNGDKRFLRGGINSGADQEDSFKQHTHPDNSGWTYLRRQTQGGNGRFVDGGTEKFSFVDAVTPQGEEETRPINMSVVWIIRVK